MTELVIGVRLKADGSGLAGPLREAKAEVAGFGNAAQAATAETGKLGQSVGAAGTAVEGLAADTRQATAATATLGAEVKRVSTTIASTTTAQIRHSAAINDNARSLSRQGNALRNAGQQVGDFGIQVATGQDIARSFGQQIGQLGFAMSEMGGRAGKVGAFLTGPWGIALTIGAAFLAPLVQSLFETADGADKAKASVDDLAKYVGDIGNFFDRATGKIKETNAALREFAFLSAKKRADEARDQQRKATKAANDVLASLPTGAPAVPGRSGIGDLYRPPVNRDVRNVLASGKNINAGLGQIALSQSPNSTAAAKILEERARFAQAAQEAAKAEAEARSIKSGVLDASLRSPGRTAKPKAGPKPKSTEARDEFGRDSADRIAGIIGQFDEAPALLDKTNAKVAQLRDLIDDLKRKQPPGFEKLIADAKAAEFTIRGGLIKEVSAAFEQPKTIADKAAVAIANLDAAIADLRAKKPLQFEELIADAETAKTKINDGLNRPLLEFLEGQEQSLAIGELVLQGRENEAEALRIINGLQRDGNKIGAEGKAQVLATVAALRAQEEQTQRVQRRQQILLGAASELRGIVADTIYGGADALKELPARIFDSFKRAAADLITEKLFGGLFAGLENGIKGRVAPDVAAIEAASVRIGGALDGSTAGLGDFTNALGQASAALSQAPVGGVIAPNGDFGVIPVGAGDITGVLEGALARVEGALSGDLVVTAKSPLPTSISNPRDLFSKFFEKGAALLGIDPKSAGVIGKAAGGALQGVFEGQAASGLASLIGIKQSSAGAAIGGGIGGAASAIFGKALGAFGPLAGAIGGLLGGTIGALFAPKAKPGGVTVGAVDGQAGQTGTSGTDKKLIAESKGLGETVSSGINQIVDQLGGTLGDFSVSIGKYKDNFRVNVGGKPLGGVKGSGATDFGNDQNAAVGFAISLAIQQGAVKGLSTAVQKAIGSSPDIEKALREATRVQQLELLIGGIGASLTKTFKDFDAAAGDRVSLAKKYGLDILQVERINGEERVKLLDETLKSRVGSLKGFLKNVQYGDLFEGTASERRAAILAEVKTAQADAEAGVAGAADQLEQLYRTLVTTSREAFGTAGAEFATDRGTAISGVERVIQIETDRIKAAADAQVATTKAIQDGNKLADEGNDLAAITNAKLDAILQAVSRGGNGGSVAAADFSATSRFADVDGFR